MITRDLIVQEARRWLGTRFHHQGRIKRNEKNSGGCDCLGLITGVAKELNIISGITNKGSNIPFSAFDSINYSRNPDGIELHKQLSKLMLIKHNVNIGDVILFYIQNRLQHLAIYSYNHSIIHSLLKARKVVEHELDAFWEEKIAQIFSFKGISQ